MPSRLRHGWEEQKRRRTSSWGPGPGVSDVLTGYFVNAWYLIFIFFPRPFASCLSRWGFTDGMQISKKFPEVMRVNPSHAMTFLLREKRDEGPRGIEHVQHPLHHRVTSPSLANMSEGAAVATLALPRRACWPNVAALNNK